MSNFTIKVKIRSKGANQIQRSLNKFVDKKLEKADKEIYESVVQMMTRASSSVSSKFPEIASSLYATRHSMFVYELGSPVKYSAYVEFGTGKYAGKYLNNKGADWQSIAAKYIINKQGKTREYPYFYRSVNYVWGKMIVRLKKIFGNA